MTHPPRLPLFFVAALTAFAAVGPAQAQAQQAADPAQVIQQMTEQFKAADKNGDGALSRAEAEAGFPKLAKRFEEVDTAKAGKVTLDQVRSFAQKQMQERPDAKK